MKVNGEGYFEQLKKLEIRCDVLWFTPCLSVQCEVKTAQNMAYMGPTAQVSTSHVPRLKSINRTTNNRRCWRIILP